MLRCRGQPAALRCLTGVLYPTFRCGWRQMGSSATVAAPNNGAGAYPYRARERRRRRAAAVTNTNSIPDGSSTGSVHGTAISAGPASTIPDAPAPAGGAKTAELRAWQQAMLELARRHSMPQETLNHSKDPNKVSKTTAEYIPEVREAWLKLVDGDSRRNLWFRGAAKFYASLLGGVWPKIANTYLERLIGMCDEGNSDGAGHYDPSPSSDGLRRRGGGSVHSSKNSVSPTAATAAAAAISARAKGGGQLDWKRGLEILKEAHNAGVVVTSDLMVMVLSKAPMGNSRKISNLVSGKGSKAFGFMASPDMLAIAAVAHWREGVVTGAVRHLDMMFARKAASKKKRLTSPGPLVHEWLVSVTQGGDPASAENEGASPPAWGGRQRQWPWLLVVVDIYGRAGRWAETAEAFDSFVSKSSSFVDLDSDRLQGGGGGGIQARLPMPDKIDVAVRRELSALPLEAWASFYPSALVHATTSYLQLGMAELAAEVLSFLKSSLEAGIPSRASAPAGSSGTRQATAAGGGGIRRVEGGDKQGDDVMAAPSHFTPAGSSDPTWIEGTVRGFARLGGWDLAPEVLSPEIVGWFSSEAGAAGGSTGRLALVFESLEAFLESKIVAKRPAPGQVDGSRACLELLKACRARGLLEGDEEALVYGEALRWLSLAPGGHVAVSEAGDQKRTPMIDAATRRRFGNDYRSMLQSRCTNLPQEAMLQAVGNAWAADVQQPEGEGEGMSDAIMERRRFAAFALYEAGIEAGALPEGGHWTSQSAGVMSLNDREYQMQAGAPLAALNLVLSDMRRKYAYEESVGRHVHQPQADLVMIVSVRYNTLALDTAKGILWLLGVCSRRHGAPLGGLELLGRGQTGHLTRPAAAAVATRQQDQAEITRMQEEALLDAVQQEQQAASKQGVVVSLPRRALQGWLLREGRARRESRGVEAGGGGLWTPSWVEDGIDVVPPTLPGFGVAEGNGAGGVSGGGVPRETPFESTVASQEAL